MTAAEFMRRRFADATCDGWRRHGRHVRRCGRRKKAGSLLCDKCWDRLPSNVQAALCEIELAEALQDVWMNACGWLKRVLEA